MSSWTEIKERYEKLDKIVDFLAECYTKSWDLEYHDLSDILAMDFDEVRNKNE